MNQVTQLNTSWSQRLRRREQPSHSELCEHLLEVHRQHTGFTEICASRSRDPEGRNSYQWLADLVDPDRHRNLLDLACGSGALTALCHQRFGKRIALIGVDMSAEELALARQRIPDPAVALHCAMAQDMGFIADQTLDAVLCHWGLTLMDPVEPVLAEVRRVLRPGGLFAAIVDGDLHAAPGYPELHHLIYDQVQRNYPGYGDIDLGDRRIRTTEALAGLLAQTFRGADIRIEPTVVSQLADAHALAQEAAGFFYAAFMLSASARAQMLQQIAALFSAHGGDGLGRFSMPINRVLVQLAAS
ncbi:MAG: methyltransferase domain-containing protein [Thiohalocapsa sp. PB-PSB1]|jgi:SAM-dependent methyltransferase|nr:MAG: hypothetical protein N838_11065 [Thiohalocapsa sp. PB-PSB1]QQO55298.1 MAG: methyltransferase domain-containing protein [Thiohalocapsa sp. PB-PSB1]HCS88897.1 class I SAM-dependent methyltransferase [Chromatiaceae bacterium]